MPTIDDLMADNRKREAARKKPSARSRGKAPGKVSALGRGGTARVPRSDTSPRPTGPRRPAHGFYRRLEDFWLLRRLRSVAPGPYGIVVEAADIWHSDGEFGRLRIDPPGVKQVVVEALERAKSFEKKVAALPIVQNFCNGARRFLNWLG
jgi:hypothetical protein